MGPLANNRFGKKDRNRGAKVRDVSPKLLLGFSDISPRALAAKRPRRPQFRDMAGWKSGRTLIMNDQDRAAAFLPLVLGIPALSSLDMVAARFIAGGSQVRTARRGQILYERGSSPTGLYCLLNGRVKLAALSTDGSERVLDLVLPGRLFGQAAAVLDEPHLVLAQVLCESRLLHVGRERICEAIIRWPEVSAILLRSVAREVYRLIHDLESCCLMTAGQRLVGFLLDEASRGLGSRDRAEVTLHASKALVASTLNLSAETFSRELHELARKGLVEVDRRTVRIPSLARLRSYAEGEENRLAAAND